MQNSRKGFTLIELLVVISIIGMLSGLVLVSVQGVRAQARDSRRLSDMRQLISGITMYYDNFESLPAATPDTCCMDWDVSPCVTEPDNPFIGMLQSSGTMGPLSDPGKIPEGADASTCTYGYAYYVFPAGSYGCDISRGSFFVLGIRNMETSENPHPRSPGFECAERNWQDEFEWVTGGFERDF